MIKRLILILLAVALNCTGQIASGMRGSAGTSISANGRAFAVQVEQVTTTAALLSYTPPDPAASCTVQVHDANTGALANDVNAAYYTSADTDTSRNTTTTDPATGKRHVLVGIKAAAPYDSSGKNRYSRALAAYNPYTYQIGCGRNTASGSFTTENIPLGYTRNDGWPADPTHPGEYGYPDLDWSNLRQTVIDPMTGVPGKRIPSGGDQASALTNFDKAVDNTGTWTVGATFLTGGPAANATVSGSTNPLLIREDSIQLYNAQSANNPAISQFDWFQVTLNASASGTCSANDCNIQYCLALGTTCYSAMYTQTLTNTPQLLTLGSQTVGDLWQGSGVYRPQLNAIDASVYSFSVNTNGTAVSIPSCNPPNNPFDLKWKAGTQITIAGVSYQIAGVTDECDLVTTTSAGTQTNATATAANFGLLVWKQNTSVNTITLSGANGSVGPQYEYGQQATNGWSADAVVTFNPTPLTVSGKSGYLGFIGPDLHWVAADGSDDRDLGVPMNGSQVCGNENTSMQFDQDPSYPATWYCIIWDSNGDPAPSRGRLFQAIFKAQYIGDFTSVTPGSLMGSNVRFTEMTPYGNDPVGDPTCIAWLTPNLKAFFATDLGMVGIDSYNPYNPFTYLDGVDEHGYLVIHQQVFQDSYGGICAYNLGNRQPVGSGAGAMASVGGISSLSARFGSWGTMHTGLAPFNGWAEVSQNSPQGGYGGGNWSVILNTALTTTVGTGDGQLQACPANAIYDGTHHPTLTGNVCSHITTTGEPTAVNGNYTGTNPFQPVQVADAMATNSTVGGCAGACEVIQVIVKNSSTDLWVYRGYQGSGIKDHPGNTTLLMNAASVGSQAYSGNAGGHLIWDYIDDPTGANPNYTTIGPDQNAYNVHLWTSPSPGSTRVWAGYAVQTGGIPAIFTAPPVSDSIFPTFYGLQGFSSGSSPESHTGNGYGNVVYDNGGFNGSTNPAGAPTMVSGSSHPWQLISGLMYECTMASGCAIQNDGLTPILHPKILETFARSGSHLLLDVSGPNSAATFGSTAWTRCYAYAAGECHAGSAVGDVFVNLGQAPYYKYCNEPNGGGAVLIAAQSDICIGDTSSFMDQSRQFLAQTDSNGAYMRNLGTSNMFIGWEDVYGNHNAAPGNLAVTKWMRFGGGYSSSVWEMLVPPIPSTDGIDRSTFEQFNVVIPAHAGATGAYVEWGYARFGADNTLAQPYCTSRLEACVAAQTAIPSPGSANPFYFKTTDTWSPVSCASGCTIPLPLLPIMSGIFYQIHWTSGGSDVAVDSVRQTLTQ